MIALSRARNALPTSLIALFAALISGQPEAQAQGNEVCTVNTPPPAVVGDMNDVVGTVSVGGTSAQATQVKLGSIFKSGPNANTLATVLRGVANEPGEKGYVAFDVAAGGQVGTGVVNGSFEGSAGLEVAYQVSDENRVVMGMDFEAALKAGVSLAGLVEFGGKIEAGGSVVKLSFPDSVSAAAWLTDQLNNINAKTGHRLYPKGSGWTPKYATPTGITDRWVAAGVYAQAGVGDYGFNGELKGKREYRTFNTTIDGKRVDVTSITDHLIGQAQFTVPFGKDKASVTYTYDEAEVSGSPFYFANGTGSDHVVNIRIPIAAVTKKLNETGGEPSEAVQDLILDTFAKVETIAPGAALKGINYKAFSAVTQHVYDAAKSADSRYARGYVTVTAKWNFVDDPNGERNMTYARLYVGGEAEAGADFNVKAVKVSTKLSAGKNELIYEGVGTRTISYVQRQYIYRTKDRPWSTFVRNNRAALEKLVEGIATDTTHPYHDPAIARVYKSKGFWGGLNALTSKWAAEDRKIEKAKTQAIKIASDSHRWQAWGQTDNIQRDIANTLRGIKDRDARNYAWNLVDDFGGDYSRILQIAKGDTNDSQRLRAAIWHAMSHEERVAWIISDEARKLYTNNRGSAWRRSSRNTNAANRINDFLKNKTPAERQEILDIAKSYGAPLSKVKTITTRSGYSYNSSFKRLAGTLRGLSY